MNSQTFTSTMSYNDEYVATGNVVDLYPRFLGVIKSSNRVHGVICWWSRYIIVEDKRKAINPKIGISLKGHHDFVEVMLDETRTKLIGKFGLFGHEVMIELVPHGKGDAATIFASVRITGEPFRHTFDEDKLLPTEYFFRSGE